MIVFFVNESTEMKICFVAEENFFLQKSSTSFSNILLKWQMANGAMNLNKIQRNLKFHLVLEYRLYKWISGTKKIVNSITLSYLIRDKLEHNGFIKIKTKCKHTLAKVQLK